MSGGSHNYIGFTIANTLGIPSGSYGIGDGKYGTYKEDVAEARVVNPMHDAELSELMYDVSCLLHSLEWFESGDIGEERYFKDVSAFKNKWFFRSSDQSIGAYRKDILQFLYDIGKGVTDENSKC